MTPKRLLKNQSTKRTLGTGTGSGYSKEGEGGGVFPVPTQLTLPIADLERTEPPAMPFKELEESGDSGQLSSAPRSGFKNQESASGPSRLTRTMEAMGTLASGIAHDFNNILTPIFLRLEMALADLEQESPLRNQLEQVLACGQRAKDLVQQILNFSHQDDEELRPLQISLVVKEMLKLLRSSLPATVEIRQDIRGSGMVLADLQQVHLLLTELCVWSTQPMDGKSGILEVSLSDVEAGFQEAEPLVFLPKGSYVKLGVKQMVRKTSGAEDRSAPEDDERMDLVLVRSIVEQHGGKMVMYKEAGEGRIINIFLPRLDPPSRAAQSESWLLPRGSERVLVVDDEQAVAEILKQMLSYLGYDVIATTSSAEALEILRNSPSRFDLMITDQTMPRMTGAELASEAVRMKPELPVLLCSGFGEMLSFEEAKKAGVRALLSKPLSAAQVAHKIREVLDATN